MKKRVRSAIRWTGYIALCTVLAVGAVQFNGNVLDARLDHLDMLLQRGSRIEAHNATELIGRYRLILRRLEEGEDSLAAFRTEAQLAALETELFNAPTEGGDDDRGDTELGNNERVQREQHRSVERAVISLLRRLTGKPVIEIEQREAVIDRIKDAYLRERRRDWAAAIDLYEAIIAEERLEAREIAVVRLHLGFCYSMNGEFDRALSIYTRVLADQPGTEEARSAAILIESLRAVVAARDTVTDRVPPRVAASSSDDDTGGSAGEGATTTAGPGVQDDVQRALDVGRTAFLRLEYDQAINAFDALLQRSLTPEAEAEARYYRARSLEERGDFTAAVTEYQFVRSLPAAETNAMGPTGTATNGDDPRVLRGN